MIVSLNQETLARAGCVTLAVMVAIPMFHMRAKPCLGSVYRKVAWNVIIKQVNLKFSPSHNSPVHLRNLQDCRFFLIAVVSGFEYLNNNNVMMIWYALTSTLRKTLITWTVLSFFKPYGLYNQAQCIFASFLGIVHPSYQLAKKWWSCPKNGVL